MELQSAWQAERLGLVGGSAAHWFGCVQLAFLVAAVHSGTAKGENLAMAWPKIF